MSRLLDVHNFVGDKLRWQTQVLLDVALSPSAKNVGCLIMHDLNVERGAAWRAQENMAVALGLSTRSVKRAIAELAGRGHLAVRANRGRGRTQQYLAMLLDAAEDHDGIDRVIATRKAAGQLRSGDAESGAQKVTPVALEGPEKVTPVSPEPSEKVTSMARKGVTGVPQYLEDSSNPPFPPTRTNRVRSAWGEPPKVIAPFPEQAVRVAIAGRLGEDGAASWLDPQAWDRDSQTIVTKLGIQAEKLQRECGRELRRLGVDVVCDKARHQALSRLPRPVIATDRDVAA